MESALAREGTAGGLADGERGRGGAGGGFELHQEAFVSIICILRYASMQKSKLTRILLDN